MLQVQCIYKRIHSYIINCVQSKINAVNIYAECCRSTSTHTDSHLGAPISSVLPQPIQILHFNCVELCIGNRTPHTPFPLKYNSKIEEIRVFNFLNLNFGPECPSGLNESYLNRVQSRCISTDTPLPQSGVGSRTWAEQFVPNLCYLCFEVSQVVLSPTFRNKFIKFLFFGGGGL